MLHHPATTPTDLPTLIGHTSALELCNLDAAATVWAAGDGSFGMTMVLFFIATQLLAHLVLGYGLWRAMIVPWWAAVCLPALPILVLDPGSSPWWAAPLLLPLLPFTIAASRLLTDQSVAMRREPAVH